MCNLILCVIYFLPKVIHFLPKVIHFLPKVIHFTQKPITKSLVKYNVMKFII